MLAAWKLMNTVLLWYFDRLFSHSSHRAMNGTDLALVTGHLEGRIGWHFTLKRKVSPKNNFLRCVAYLLQTIYHHKSSSNPSPRWLCHHCLLYNTFLSQTLCPHPVAVAGRTVLSLCHTVTPISNTPPICSRPSHITTVIQMKTFHP